MSRPSYEGEYYRYTLDSYVFNPGPIDYPDPRIAIAAVRPRNTALGAEIADGVMWHAMLSWAYRDQVLLPAVKEGARAGGKDPKDLIISGGGFVITARDEERLQATLGEARRQIAFYASTRTYQDSIKMAGYEDEGALLHRLSIEQRWAEMAKIVDDDFMEQFSIVATWDELPAKMAERYAGVNTEVGFHAGHRDARGRRARPRGDRAATRDPGLRRGGAGGRLRVGDYALSGATRPRTDRLDAAPRGSAPRRSRRFPRARHPG